MEAFAIAGMPRLLSLHLVTDNLDNEGLSAILDNWPHLELLDLCYNGCSRTSNDPSLYIFMVPNPLKKQIEAWASDPTSLLMHP